jgi:hypothetical protein
MMRDIGMDASKIRWEWSRSLCCRVVLGEPVKRISAVLTLCGLLAAVPAFAQAPSYSLDQRAAFVAPIALYPDPLLAQVLAAATFSDQLRDADRWADQHRDLKAEPLALAMQRQRLPWDPTVQSLLPFPSVLDMMAADLSWSTNLGNAFLVQQQSVLTAIQTERAKAQRFGYLASNKRIAVPSLPYVAILPIDPAQIPVPSYDPAIVFSAPPRGLVVADAIRYVGVPVGGFVPAGFTVAKFQVIGGYFQAWGWGLGGINWAAHTVVINGTPWRRTWANRGNYVHRYPDLEHIAPAQ